jgi:hypothetical protein
VFENQSVTRADKHLRLQTLVQVFISVGICFGIVGLAVGLRMALKATVVGCPDGHYFPEGTTDFRCFAHQHAGVGTAIVVFSVLLAILVGLCGTIAVMASEAREANRPVEHPVPAPIAEKAASPANDR